MKKKTNWFLVLLSFSFIIFLAFYIALESGYYEAKVTKKSIMTEEKIMEFEQDVANNEPIDINKYVTTDYVDYSSPASRAGQKVALVFEKVMDGGISDFFGFLGGLFT